MRKHHQSLCPVKFAPTKANWNNEEKIEPAEIENACVADGEKVVVQTALVKVMNRENDTHKETRILLDTDSQRTYILEELTVNLNLKSIKKGTYTVYTFGNNKPKVIITTILELRLISAFGKDITITATVLSQITGLIQQSPFKIPQWQLLEKEIHAGRYTSNKYLKFNNRSNHWK